jgi:hypothetical protein
MTMNNLILALCVGLTAAQAAAPLQAAEPAGILEQLAGLSVTDPMLKRFTAQPLAKDGPIPRSTSDAHLFAIHAPSVVLIIGENSFGSGSIISPDGLILTNNHVVDSAQRFSVALYRPDGNLNLAIKLQSHIVKVDQIADLALLKIDTPPPGLPPLRFGQMQDIVIGMDVHAIGHPKGHFWSYTKGQVSQIRAGYDWLDNYHATVIQTQTPILPGNSGGPLLTDSGLIIGVNAFIDPKVSSLNYAVSLADITAFLSRPDNRYAPVKAASSVPAQSTQACSPRIVRQTRDAERHASMTLIDIDCDKQPDIVQVKPDNPREAEQIWVDRNRDGRTDLVIYDDNRDGKWDRSLHDTDFDGIWDMFGRHADGGLIPTSLEPYIASN